MRVSDHSYKEWTRRARGITFPEHAFIGGEARPSRSRRVMKSVNPATGAVNSQIASCSIEDIDDAVGVAREAIARGVWASSDAVQRRAVLLQLSELIWQNADELALLVTLDMGMAIRDAAGICVPSAAMIFSHYAQAIDKPDDGTVRDGAGDFAERQDQPLGVIGAVLPWNCPLEVAAATCAPILAAGNCVVLKPAEQATHVALRLAELALQAGLPPGVLNVVSGLGPTAGQAVGRHMDVDGLLFTGSTAIGKMYLQYSGQSNGKKVWLQTGCRNASIVFADCPDLEAAARFIAFRIFSGRGNVCPASSPVFVEHGVEDKLIDLLANEMEAYQPGDPLDPETGLGPMVDADHAANVERFLDAARCSAELVAGGERVDSAGNGHFVRPAIFRNVDPQDSIASEELFGPVLLAAPFEGDDEAIWLAGGARAARNVCVWTSDANRARRVASQVRAENISVNPVMSPKGGVPPFHLDRDLLFPAIQRYTALKTIRMRY